MSHPAPAARVARGAPGATHAPHHPTPEWIKKISDMQQAVSDWKSKGGDKVDSQREAEQFSAGERDDDALADAPAVHRLEREHAKNQHVERAA